MKDLRIVLLGLGGVGKSALAQQFLFHQFTQEYDPTIEQDTRKVVTVDGETFRIDVLDTAGDDKYPAIRDQYMRACDGFLFVYDITNHQTMSEVETLRLQMIRVRDEDPLTVPVVICGNKSDLSSDRSVSTKYGAEYAKSVGFPFIETSAKTAENVDEAFFSVVRGYMSLQNNSNKENPLSNRKERNKCIIC